MKHIMSALVAAFIITVCLSVYSQDVNHDLSQSMIRLHVIANSDTDEDQALKLQVRDAVIHAAQPLLQDASDKADSRDALLSHTDELERAARETVIQNGYDYPVTVEYGNFYFPLKRYANVMLPSGDYDAFRVKIGQAEGKNWWCVMFPPLCFVNETTGEMDEAALQQLKAAVSEDEYELITNSEDGDLPVVMRFKVVDWFMNLREKLKQV